MLESGFQMAKTCRLQGRLSCEKHLPDSSVSGREARLSKDLRGTNGCPSAGAQECGRPPGNRPITQLQGPSLRVLEITERAS